MKNKRKQKSHSNPPKSTTTTTNTRVLADVICFCKTTNKNQINKEIP